MFLRISFLAIFRQGNFAQLMGGGNRYVKSGKMQNRVALAGKSGAFGARGTACCNKNGLGGANTPGLWLNIHLGARGAGRQTQKNSCADTRPVPPFLWHFTAHIC